MVSVIGKKIGMSRLYQENGLMIPVTLIEIYDSLVSDIKRNSDKSYDQLTLSFGQNKNTEKKISNSVLGFYKKNNLSPYRDMQTFKIPKDAPFNVGDKVGIEQIELGSEVDVIGVSKGKGFAGVIKRHNFSGEGASHGVSLTHRHQGGTGWRRREGRVIKGKSMPGHLGSEQVTIKNLKVVKVLPEDRVVCLKGAVPGAKGSKIIIKKSN